MKKTVIVLALAALLIAPSCAKPEHTETQNAPTQNDAAAPEQAPAAEESAHPYTFAGTYMEENADPESTYMRADISGNVIEINWIMDSGKTVALYWAGTFQQPAGAGGLHVRQRKRHRADAICHSRFARRNKTHDSQGR